MNSRAENLKMKSIRTPQRTNRRNVAIGLILVVISGLGVWFTIQVNNRTEEFLIAGKAAASGAEIGAGGFRAVRMNLGNSGKLYLQPGDVDKKAYLLVGIDAGQLVPKSFLATRALDSRKPVIISSKMPLPTNVKVGDLVDVWVSRVTANNQFSPPVQIVIDAEIADILESSSIMSDQTQQVQVLVPDESVATIIDAIASKDVLSLVMHRNLGND